MRVSLNDAISLRGPSGTARGTRLLEAALGRLGADVEVLVPRPPGEHKAVNALRATAWDFGGFDRRATGDVLVSPTNVGVAPSGRPHVLWVHDTMVLDHPGWFDRAYAAHARLTFRPSVLRATAVATASSHSRDSLLRRWPTVRDKVHVLPWPVAGGVAQPRTSVPAGPTVLMLGATEPHKRHGLGIDAVRRLRRSSGVDVRLHVVGPAGRREAEVRRHLGLADPSGTWTSRLTLPDRSGVDAQLESAWVLLQCSLDEGFCLPLVEAGSRAVPAVHTGGGSMAEVHPAGDCHSDSPDALADRMVELLDPGSYARASVDATAVAIRHSESSFDERFGGLLGQLTARP